MREVVLDTETTGMSPRRGDRIVEIACLELFAGRPTGRSLQHCCNPGRPIDWRASRVHGLRDEDVQHYPPFAEVAGEILAFIGDSPLVIHNAPFDLGFLHLEMTLAGRGGFTPPGGVIDTLSLARKLLPGQRHNLDALCRRFAVDNAARTCHGALLDCRLLAQVYAHLCRLETARGCRSCLDKRRGGC